MNTCKPVAEILKTQFEVPFQNARSIYLENVINIKGVVAELENITTALRQGLITFKKISRDEGKENDNIELKEEIKENCIRPSKPLKKKRGRPIKTLSSQEDSQVFSENFDVISLDDSSSSTSSTRSRRAAAQAADQKLVQVQNFIKAKKLRRPTNYSEKSSKYNSNTSTSPSKCNLTNGKHNSESSQEEEIDQIAEDDKNNRLLQNINNENPLSRDTTNSCSVAVQKLSTPQIKSLTNKRKSSQEEEIDQIAKDDKNNRLLQNINNENPLSRATTNICSVAIQKLSTPEIKSLSNRRSKSRSSERFSGKRKSDDLFIDVLNSKKAKENESEDLQKLQHQGRKSAKRTFVLDPTCTHTLNSEIEDGVQNTKFPATELIINELSGDEFNGFDQKSVGENFNDGVAEIKETKTSKKKASQVKTEQKHEKKQVKDTAVAIKNGNDESLIVPSPEYKKIQTTNVREIKTDDEEKVEEGIKQKVLIDGGSPEVNIRSRTKTIRKHEEKSTFEEEAINLEPNNKVNESDNISIENQSKDLKSKFKQPIQVIDKQNKRVFPKSPMSSPAADCGDLVKKRVKDFEKLKNGPEEVQEEKRTGRITRNAAKNKATSCLTEPQKSKTTHNIPFNTVGSNTKVLSAERARLTPLTVNNRMTPGFDSSSKIHVINKGVSSATRQNPVENNHAFIQKQAADEVEKRRKEEERIKRQTKEEEAKKKKEKTLKATSEETRRKREEKLQKVAAAREAAEREKALLAVKAEKDKEEKMRQMAAEKEKQKEEQLKKKLLIQQKALEHEERRKQEEAARLAKLKEQEEEHKRLLAMKEREQEMAQKHQKGTEQRLAESEKNKHQGAKAGKLPLVNNTKGKLPHGSTPSENSNAKQAGQSYEITPAREDRPLLQPKTENNYGIDDAHSGDSSDEETQPKKMIPLWAQMENRQHLLRVSHYLPKGIWNKFMEADTHPDVNRIFAGNHIKKRIRTSSAVWKTPPRCSHQVSK